ncbi:MAG: hypothetical protein H6551_05580 [Chitinophagales bacterium]|nr:hypothetical protein [Chitinophagaceae bacterium]MCB9064601.1 hypothetical protein [Chitinophagales bacterium]
MNLLKCFFIATIMLCGEFSYAQGERVEHVSKEDSIALHNALNIVMTAIEQRDTLLLKSVSLGEVDCVMCVNRWTLPKNYLVPIDTFIKQSFDEIPGSRIANAYHTRPLHITVLTPEMYSPIRESNQPIYEVWVQTLLPDEWVEGHEGASHAFWFKRLSDEFKFCGMTSIP